MTWTIVSRGLLGLVCVALLPAILSAQRKPATAKPPTSKPAGAKGGFFTTPLTLEQMKNKQAVVQTSAGTIVIQLLPEAAPNHVGYFMKLAQEGAYAGTTFHRAVLRGIVQGGDPLSKDPAKAKLYGTGGLGVLKPEIGSEPATRGAVAAVLQPKKPDSGGAQFFVCVTDQPSPAQAASRRTSAGRTWIRTCGGRSPRTWTTAASANRSDGVRSHRTSI